jgi:hypothetical protein
VRVSWCRRAHRAGHLLGNGGVNLLFDQGVLYRRQQVFGLRELEV